MAARTSRSVPVRLIGLMPMPESVRTVQPSSSFRKRSRRAAWSLPAGTSKPAYTSSVFSRNTTMSTSSGRRTGEGTPG